VKMNKLLRNKDWNSSCKEKGSIRKIKTT
jgi:hypothetical protein